MTATHRLGLLGGTFDPIHVGHLDAAYAARRALDLGEILLVPSHDPPHRPRDPRATPFHRFAMVSLAINGCDGLRASDLELRREGRTYTIDTLRALHGDGWAPSQIFFILGADAFAEIASWHQFPALLDAAHFVVVARPGATLDAAIARTLLIAPRVTEATDPRLQQQTGVILVAALTRDVSSTAVRDRLAAGEPLDDLVPATVARHIAAHRLYSR